MAILSNFFCTHGIANDRQDLNSNCLVSDTLIANTHGNQSMRPSKMLVIDAYDAATIQARKNKKKLFKDLTDSVLTWVAHGLREQGVETIIVADIIKDQADLDSLVVSLLKENSAAQAIVLTSLDAWFDLTHVDVEKSFDRSKTKTAFFDLCSVINCELYDQKGLLKKSSPQMRRYFTSRQTASSFLCFGPDIVGKRKYVIDIMHANARKLLTEL